ncbi:MAG: hypothetical protein LBT92_01215 [Rickettsiales bacterium]|jgi:hypothetical protein|nr:hypothetical protein [Rickettsiales bacterium]
MKILNICHNRKYKRICLDEEREAWFSGIVYIVEHKILEFQDDLDDLYLFYDGIEKSVTAAMPKRRSRSGKKPKQNKEMANQRAQRPLAAAAGKRTKPVDAQRPAQNMKRTRQRAQRPFDIAAAKKRMDALMAELGLVCRMPLR